MVGTIFYFWCCFCMGCNSRFDGFMRKFVFLFLFLLVGNAYSADTYWQCTGVTGGNWDSPDAFCNATYPSYCSGGICYSLYSIDYINNGNSAVCGQKQCQEAPGTWCGGPYGVQTCNLQTCPSGQEYSQSSRSCISKCTSPQVRNPLTGQCQDPCESGSSETVSMALSGSYMIPNPAFMCLNGCQVQYNMPNSGQPCRFVSCSGGSPGCFIGNEYECLSINSQETGEFCSGNESGFTLHPPDDCPSGWFLSGGACMQDPLCGENEHLENHQCIVNPDCGESSHYVDGQCVPDPSCDENEVKQEHECVPLQCEPGQEAVNHECRDPVCGDSSHLVGHFCVPDPNCDVDEVKVGHECVSLNCGVDEEPVNHHCEPIQCISGMKYSYILHQCIMDDLNCPLGQHKEGLSCVSDQPPRQDCPDGYLKNGDRCEKVPDMKCPPNTVKRGDQCVSVVNPSCPSGTHYESGQCVSDKQPDVHCPAGTHVVGNGCDSDSPPTVSCPSGFHVSGNLCVSDAGPDNGTNPPTCPAGSHLSGSSCVQDSPPTVLCPSGQHLMGNVCVVDDEGVVKTCDEGMALVAGKCVSAPTCPDGQQLQEGVCTSVEVPTCPPGSKLEGALCVSGTVKSCETGFILVGGKCVLNGAAVNPGAGTGTGTGAGTGSQGEGQGTCDPANEDCGQGTGVVPFASLYEKKGVEFSVVWGDFISRVQAAPIVGVGSTFFTTMGSYGGTCPTWIFPSTRFWGSYTFDLLCTSQITRAFEIVAVVILLVCAFIAFEIAFL